MSRRWQLQLHILFVFALALSTCAPGARAWGNNANKLIVNRAIDTLPADLRPFFDASRAELLNHVNDPFVTVAKTPAERKNQFLLLEKYGRFPFELLPRSYKAAVAKFEIQTRIQRTAPMANRGVQRKTHGSHANRKMGRRQTLRRR